MRHLYKYIFVLLGIFLFACTTDFEEVAVKDNSEAEGQSNYSASQKAALAELTYMLNTMDSAALKTRGYSNARTIKNIDVVRSSISGTRSNGIDTLLFLVNFEDEKGYAILGANDNFSDVIAIVYNGNLSVNEFLFPQYNCEDCTEVYGLYEHIFNYALKKCEENSAAGATRAAKGYPGARQFLHQRMPMLTTKWHQRYPYNVLCPVKDGKNCLAGCVAVAVAQVIAYNKLTYGKGVNELQGYKLDWNGIFEEMKNPGSNTYAAATLIRAVGKCVGMEYGLDSSSSNIYNALNAFVGMSCYSNLEIHNYTGNNAHTMVFDRDMPAYVRGDGYLEDGSKSAGHAWVVDGIIKYEIPIYDKPYNPFDPIIGPPPTLIGLDNDYVVHCNFGWENGLCNGHYNTGIFNLIDGAVELDPGSDKGWIASYQNVKMIMYRK